MSRTVNTQNNEDRFYARLARLIGHLSMISADLAEQHPNHLTPAQWNMWLEAQSELLDATGYLRRIKDDNP